MQCEWSECPGTPDLAMEELISREDGVYHEGCLGAMNAREAATWAEYFQATPDEALAYDAGDYKNPDYLDELLDRADTARKDR